MTKEENGKEERGKEGKEKGLEERKILTVLGKTLTVGESSMKGIGKLSALFFQVFGVFKSFQIKIGSRGVQRGASSFKVGPLKQMRAS